VLWKLRKGMISSRIKQSQTSIGRSGQEKAHKTLKTVDDSHEAK
jgi:hypothetical protein